MFTNPILTALTGLLSLSSAALIGPNDTPAPWEISSISTFSPSGRPGSSPYSIVNITITDPNDIAAGPSGMATFPPSTAICNASFVGSDPPYNKVIDCSETEYGSWTFEMLESSNTSGWQSATTNFDVRFTRVNNVTVVGEVFSKVYVGRAHFEVGANMRGVCGASGVCSWGLKEEERPYLVNQTLVSCTGVCPSS
ncbi:hypothetical protein GE09DRAFT_218451 [Coniochaeta sp. 2T2.1]|nr:hypothetical protein GE09DRAFT_218451 [Coniochaeta sp. 2T2.1]